VATNDMRAFFFRKRQPQISRPIVGQLRGGDCGARMLASFSTHRNPRCSPCRVPALTMNPGYRAFEAMGTMTTNQGSYMETAVRWGGEHTRFNCSPGPSLEYSSWNMAPRPNNCDSMVPRFNQRFAMMSAEGSRP
ncbi:hypothetical protein FKM82_007474, partial [Ascaphus truei]